MVRSAIVAVLMLLAIVAAGAPAEASTDAEGIASDVVVQQASTVVAGRFTGGSSVHVRELAGQLDTSGRPVRLKEAFTLFDFDVAELVDGSPVPPHITIEVVGGESDHVSTPLAFVPPPPEERIGLALMPVNGGVDRYLIVHSRKFEASSRAKLESFRSFVREARKPAPVDPDEQVEREEEISQPELQYAPADDAPTPGQPDVPDGFVAPAPPAPGPSGLPGPIATPLGPPAPPGRAPGVVAQRSEPPRTEERRTAPRPETERARARDEGSSPTQGVARSAETGRLGVGLWAGAVALLLAAGSTVVYRARRARNYHLS